MKLAANLNFLFTEGNKSIAEKIRLAHKAGFRAVEIPFPNAEQDDVLQTKVDTGIQICLINIALGDSKFGSASETINFAKKVNCKKIHIMAGLIEADEKEHLTTYKSNLKYAAPILAAAGIVGVIEPINKYSLPNYFMNSFQIAYNVISEVNSKQIRLMIDIFHLQHIMGNVTNAFADFKDIIGHIQIAQAPHRHEPDVAGELDFPISLRDWIGCEYKPKTNTLEGLKWLEKYQVQL
ncbi:unnamed protein product [Ceratitis capitata]|uniref:Putative hydroxypyruvate isomerase n=1 Tax=Ceratitis capitata TaxID=7213 RepID=A0A811UAW2_CERCA|nr:unnamed protein product [Ceratitis capitata]